MGPRCDWDDEGLTTADWNPICSCIWREGGTCNCKMCQRFFLTTIKVTVQFETERNGQNEIVSHMDRSEIKL